MSTSSRTHGLATRIVLLVSLLTIGSAPSFAQRGNQTIDAHAFGTSTQMGRNVGVRLIIYEFSSPEDRDLLVQAFQKGQNEGLVNALSNMKTVGRIQIPGTLGFDVSYIAEILTPTGRQIRFVTNRRIAFGEALWDTRSRSFDLTAGQFNIDDQSRSKSDGVLYPAAQLVINKDGDLEFNLNQNAWRLANIIEWNRPSGQQ